MKRSNAIDFVRGLVMIIMALDHTRDLIHVSSIVQSPTNLATTTPILFLRDGLHIYVRRHLFFYPVHQHIFLLKRKTILLKVSVSY